MKKLSHYKFSEIYIFSVPHLWKSFQGQILLCHFWVFYLEGHSKSSYLPFPAKLISPGSEEQVNLDNGRFIFQWEGRDLDNDIISFDFYLGEDIDELKLINSGLTGTSIEIELEVGKNYYWKIITTDSKGNTSSSLGSFSTSA